MAKDTLDDNARKFITEPLDAQFLDQHTPSSFALTVNWLETGKDNETKVAYKQFDNGDIQILLISKVTKNGSRTAEKEKITEQKYKELVASSVLHLAKKRYEFVYTQNNIPFSVKYDVFENGKLCMLEVDASNDIDRDLFNPTDFPTKLHEVTGDLSYYGYRVATTLENLTLR